MQNRLVFDFETTSLIPSQLAPHQLGAILYKNNTKLIELDIRMKPHKNADINKYALEVGNISKEQIMQYPDAEQGLNKLIKAIYNNFNGEPYLMIGYNNKKFDNPILNYLDYRVFGGGSFSNYKIVDVLEGVKWLKIKIYIKEKIVN